PDSTRFRSSRMRCGVRRWWNRRGWRGVGYRGQWHRRGQRKLLHLCTEIEDLAGARLDLGGRRAQRRLLDQLGILEPADQLAGVGRLAAHDQVALRVLAAEARPHFELGYPGVVGEDAGDSVEQLDE